ncbi:MAG: Spy/CpxP family protein refolding chaperone [bacterium]
MKRQLWYTVTALLVTAFCVSALQAQPRQRTRAEGMHERLAEALNLSDEQKAQIRQIMVDTRKKNIDTKAKLELAQLELHELMRVDAPDQKKIDAKITEVSKLRETMMRARIESRLAMQKLLTPEQRKKMQELRPFERFRYGRSRFGGHDRGLHEPGGYHFGWEDVDSPEEL